MNCDLFRDLSSDHIDGATTLAEARALDDHLNSCAHCAARHDDFNAMRALLGELRAESGFPDLSRSQGLTSSRSAGRWLTANLIAASEHLSSGAGRAVATLVLVLALWPAVNQVEDRDEIPPPIAMMTVWDSGAEQIVASVATDGSWQPPAPRQSDAANSGVRIFLFEKIIVRG